MTASNGSPAAPVIRVDAVSRWFGSVVAVRPDLVHAARPTLAARELELRPGLGRASEVA